jgi:hypothetical protein
MNEQPAASIRGTDRLEQAVENGQNPGREFNRGRPAAVDLMKVAERTSLSRLRFAVA